MHKSTNIYVCALSSNRRFFMLFCSCKISCADMVYDYMNYMKFIVYIIVYNSFKIVTHLPLTL